MARLEISLLGAFEVTFDGEPIATSGYDKVRALLAYLAVESKQAHRRGQTKGD